jgi:hypothetical protein
MPTPDLLIHYANHLAIDTKTAPYTGSQWDALIDGLDTLRICSSLFTTHKPHCVVEYMHTLSPRHLRTLYVVISIIFKTSNWMRLEREAIRDAEVSISAVVWVLKMGPRGLALGRAKGRTEMQMVLGAEKAWVAANEGTDGFWERREELVRVAAEVVVWGRGAAGLFGKK